jgi:quinol monooxygenase YgiN
LGIIIKGKLEEYKALTKELIEESRKEEGCITIASTLLLLFLSLRN